MNEQPVIAPSKRRRKKAARREAQAQRHGLNKLVHRRSFLIATSATGALVFTGYFGKGFARRKVGEYFTNGEYETDATSTGAAKVDMWFEVPVHGPVVLYSPNVEMGQGVHTALAQMAAEELELDSDQIVVRAVPSVTGKGTTSRGFGAMTATAASRSVVGAFGPLRSSAAMLREILLLEGAKQLAVSRDNVIARNGAVVDRRDDTRRLLYGEIVAAKKGSPTTWPKPTGKPPLKEPKDFTKIGTDFARVDADAKLRGTAVYGYDARLPDMAFGAVAHPPRYGAKLTAANDSSVKSMPGVLKIVIDIKAGFAGVVAQTRAQAHAAAEALDLTWTGGTTVGDADIEAELQQDGGAVVHEHGNAGLALRSGEVITAEYRTAAAAHAHLEPIAALASVTADWVEVWASTQQPDAVASEVAGVLKSKRPVKVHPTYLGGGFGRKFFVHAAADATRLSEAVGRPVHLGWTREQDMRYGPFRPPTLAKLRGTVGPDGRIVAIDQRSHSGPVTSGVPGIAFDILQFDPGGLTGQVLPYAIDHYCVTSRIADVEVPTGIWRGVGLLPNAFAVETFMDELAHAAKRDPLEFRLDHLPKAGPRAKFRPLLEEVGRRSEWKAKLRPGQGRGVACSVMAGTFVATVVRVEVVDGRIMVREVHVCADPGLVINPAGARLQIAGAVMMGLSSALHERVSFRDGMAVPANFDEYRILGPDDAPPIDVHLMGTGDLPAGLGEPGIGPVATAVGNAVFAASGQRLRSIPFVLPKS